MKTSFWNRAALLALATLPCALAAAPLANFDNRAPAAATRTNAPSLNVSRDTVTGAPKFVTATSGFLTGPDGAGKNVSARSLSAIPATDPHRALKAFLNDHRSLYGHGAEALDAAQVTRDFTGAHNGLRTTVWQQHVGGVAVFESVLIAHVTKKGELVNVASQFVPNPAAAATAAASSPALTAPQAIVIAAKNLSESVDAAAIAALDTPTGAEQKQKFTAPSLNGDTTARLVWLPMSATTLALCWEVTLTSKARGEMFLSLVDAQTGEVVIRRCLTEYISAATYNVYTSDSPSPFSPGWPTPDTGQPAVVSRSFITIPALDTNASPAGWINDGDNETLGNNVDAHTDSNNDNVADLPRPHGAPARTFDFTLNLALDPTNYSAAAVVQLFYWCNFMHDKLYALGFTEAAGNFQSNNFGRGGIGGDAVQADAQDGGGFNNANMSTQPDGNPPRMQMYIFNGPSPHRDGDLDAEVVLHEYTHGLSNRRVGGGVGISALQTGGMGEGWSDFYALCLLSESGDDPNAAYSMGGYATYQFFGLAQNYYYGIRRYPYCTDMTKNPLTFKDIDPTQADLHLGLPVSPISSTNAASANEVHRQGEVWCVTLWDMRANLIAKYGTDAGNLLTLQLVTDGMNLSPANPTFLEARDAIIQADQVDNGGANFGELWAAFAKRGMGDDATSPDNSTTTGVVESYNLPDDLRISPKATANITGAPGGPFTPASQTYVLTNAGTSALFWIMSHSATWLDVSPTDGILQPGETTNVIAITNASAATLDFGNYPDSLQFLNLNNSLTHARAINLGIRPANFYTEIFTANDFDLDHSSLTFTPDGSASFYSVCRMAAGTFPTDPTGGTSLGLTDDSSAIVTLSGANSVQLYNRHTNVFFVGSNGYITFDTGDAGLTVSAANHFLFARIAAMLQDLNPSAAGSVTKRELGDRVAITWQGVPVYGTTSYNDFQIELFYDGRIRITFLRMDSLNGVTGLSDGLGVPPGFVEDNLSAHTSCSNQAPVIDVQPVANKTVGAGNSVTNTVAVSGSVPMTYQWKLSGTNLPGATNVTLILTAVATNQSGTYSFAATNAFGYAISSNSTLVVSNVVVLSLATALDTTNLTWTTGGTLGWVTQTTNTHDGIDAANSGAITHSQESWVQAVITNGPGTLTFWWQVSSEANFDYLEFYTNAVLQSGRISGTGVAWAQKSYFIPGGSQTMKWRYVKDGSVSSGLDRGFVDQVVFTPDVPFRFLTPQVSGGNVVVGIASTNSAPLDVGQTNRIKFYSSTNVALAFSNWTLVTNTMSLSNGVLKLNGLTATNPVRRFFRAVQSP